MREERRERVERLQQAGREKWMAAEDLLVGDDSPLVRLSRHMRARPLIYRWFVVILSVGASWIVGLLFRPESTEAHPAMFVAALLMLYLPAVLASALYGGSLCGSAAAFMGAGLALLSFHPESRLETVAGYGSLLLYFMCSGIMILMSRAQHAAQREIRRQADELEARVAERTAEVQIANRELASFCYSISHDLRAPMRNIVGSSRILEDDLGGSLDADSRRRLQGLAVSANRLSDLVDDLLDYARLAGADLRLDRIDMSATVEAAFERFLAQGYAISYKVEPGLITSGDTPLIASAIRSMIENSIKFAAPGRRLRIEFGETRLRNGLYYCLSDNGIGFDNQYVGKIFEPFQRLHRDTDYPGTGIGLARVKRIIDRHEGEIFAEGRPGDGASFYFRLGTKQLGTEHPAAERRVVMAEEA